MDDFSRRAIAMFAVLLAGKLATFQAFAQPGAKPSECNQPTPEAISFVELPGHPFMPIPTRDGCWIFVSLENPKNGPPSGVAILERSHGTVSLSRVIPTDSGPAGMVLTHDGKLLIGAVDDRLIFLDTRSMTT